MSILLGNCAAACPVTVSFVTADNCNLKVKTGCYDRLVFLTCQPNAALLGLRGIPLNPAAPTAALNTPAAIASILNGLASNGGVAANARMVRGMIDEFPENGEEEYSVTACQKISIGTGTELIFSVRLDFNLNIPTTTTPLYSGMQAIKNFVNLNQGRFSAFGLIDCQGDFHFLKNPNLQNNTSTSTSAADYFARGTMTAAHKIEKVADQCVNYWDFKVKLPDGFDVGQPEFNLGQVTAAAPYISGNWI